MNHSMRKDWRAVSEAAAREQDPRKLMELVEELNRLLEERENELKGRSGPEPRHFSARDRLSQVTV